MPKTLASRIKLEGENELRAALKNLKASYKELESGLKAVTSSTKDQANELDTLRQKNEALTKMYSKQKETLNLLEKGLEQAQAAQESYTQKAQAAREALAALGERTEENAKEYDKQAKKLQEAELKQQQATNTVTAYSTECNLAKVKLNDLNYELEQNKKYLQEAEKSTDHTAKSIDKFGKNILEEKNAVDELATAIGTSGLQGVLEKVKDALVDCAEASIEFESAIAGIFKTIDGTQEQLRAISDGVSEMSLRIPAAATEIAGVAEAAGQLGIKTEDILQFSEVMINLGVATNLSAEEAASSLAKFANITGMSADNYSRLGSVIVDLGNSMATTEKDIVAMGMNIASAGKQAGLTEDQIMGMAAALSSVGLEAEAGGTAISRLLIQMQTAAETGAQAAQTIASTGYTLRELEMLADSDAKAFKAVAHSLSLTTDELKAAMSTKGDLEQFAEICGMTGDEFARAFGADAAGTISQFFVGLGSGSQSAIAVLEEMGVTETRLRDTMLRLASSGDVFSSSLRTASGAWKQNTALADEANKRYATTESRIQLCKNAFQNLKVVIGDQLTPTVGILADAGGNVSDWLAQVIKDCPALVPLLAGATTGFSALAVGVSGVSVALKVVKPLWETFNATMAASPLMWAAAAVGAVTAGVIALTNYLDSLPTQLEKITTASENMAAAQQRATDADSTLKLVDRYRELRTAIDSGKLSSEELARAQEELADVKRQLVDLSGGLISATENETAAFDDQVDVIEKITEADRELARQEAISALREFGQEYQSTIDEQARLEKKAEEARTQYYKQWNADLNGTGKTLKDVQVMAAALENEAPKILGEPDGLDEYNKKLKEIGSTLSDVTGHDYNINYWEDLQFAIGDAVQVSDGLLETWEDAEKEAGQLGSAIQEGLATAYELIENGAISASDAAALLGITEDELTQAMTSAAEQITVANTSIAESETSKATAIQESTAAVTADMQALLDEYNEAYAAALETADGVAGAFENMSERSTASLSEMTDNLASQADYWDEYNSTLSTALGKVDPEMQTFILSFANGSQESLGYLQAIANGSDTEITALCDNLRRVQEGKNDFAAEIAGMKTDFDTRAKEIEQRAGQMVDEVKSQTADWTTAGQQNVQGYIDGMLSKLGEVQAIAQQIAAAGVASAQAATDQHSPSRVYRRLAQMDFAGYILGAEESEQDVRAAVRRTAEGAAEAAGAVRLASAQSGPRSTAGSALRTDERSASAGQSGGTAHITLVADGKVLGEIVTPYVSDAIQRRAVQLGRGKGR